MKYLRSYNDKEFHRLWWTILWQVFSYGERSCPREQATIEVLGLQVHLEDLRNCLIYMPARDLNPRFAIAEWLWIQAGRDDVATVARYNKHIAQFSDDGKKFTGAYGPRLASQWEYLLAALRKPDSRQAVATIWTLKPEPSKDIPCTISWQLLLRNNQLHAIVTMRSSDLWLGLPYDMFNFAMMTNGIAGNLGVEPGSITFQLGSAHIYERNFEGVQKVLSSFDGHTVRQPKLPEMAPANMILDNAARIADMSVSIGLFMKEPWWTYQEALWQPNKENAWRILHGTTEY